MSTAPELRRPETLRLHLPPAAPVELLFWERSGATFVIATGPEASWYRALRSGAPLLVEWPGGRTAQRYGLDVGSGPERTEVEGGFRAKYGEDRWRRHFLGAWRAVRLTPERPAATGGPYERIREEFDLAASGYGERVAVDPVEAELRRRSVRWLLRTFRGCDPLLEIGSGTGLETLPLLAAGHRVTSIDLSPGMLAQLDRRVREAGLEQRWEGRLGHLGTVGTDLPEYADGHFGGACSTFGAFNLEPDLAGAGEGLRRLLRRGAPLAVGILGPTGIAPIAYAVAQRHGGEIRARLARPFPAGATRYRIEVMPWSPLRLRGALGGGFALRRVAAAAVLLPPQDFPRVRRWFGPAGWGRFLRVDDLLSRTPGAGYLAEWAFVELRRA